MRISEIFNLNKSQYELDFVDIDIEEDTPLFLDPYFISKCDFPFGIDAHRTIESFFSYLLRMLNVGNMEIAEELFSHLGETNEIRLGLSRGRPVGKGMGPTDADKIFKNLLDSRALKTGLMADIEDFRIFVPNVDRDKMSDMTANIVKKHLIEYTQTQCKNWGIPLISGVPSGFFWDRKENEWKNEYTNMLVIDNQKIILVPKRIVSFSKEYTSQQYLQHFVLNFLQDEHLRLNSHLVKRRRNKKRTKYVNKKDIRKGIENNQFIDKNWLAKFTHDHPEIFEKFKKNTTKKLTKVKNTDIEIKNLKDICDYLINRLDSIPSGTESATIYHRTVMGIMELLFYPFLCSPTAEERIHEGRKRIDITFDNCAESGFFFRLSNTYGLPSQFIMVECKNYSRDIANPELDQLGGRFSPNRGQVGIVVCREIKDFELFLNRCSDTYKDHRGLIIPLVDGDLKFMLSNYEELSVEVWEELLQKRYHSIAIT